MRHTKVLWSHWLGELKLLTTLVFIGFASNAAITGQPYGAIRTTVIERTADGDPIVNSNGDYLVADDVEVTGDPNPDFTTSLINSVSWKGFTLGAQLDYRHGGDIFSVTAGAVVGTRTC